MSRRRKEKKRKEKRLERIPEKLQRKRERRERYRVRRTPRSVTYGLVISLLIVIVVAGWILLPKVEPPPPPPELGTVHILQEDTFYIFINENGSVNVQYMHGRYGVGTQLGEIPLNLTITRDFGEPQVNFTFPESSVYYDYFGNAYNIVPSVESDSYEYTVNNIFPTFLEGNGTSTIGHEEMTGYWAVFWDYLINSSQNLFLAQDAMASLFNFTFSITPENGTLIYNTPTIVHCNITFHNPPDGTNVYNYGKVHLLFPKQVYNESTLLADITLANVELIGSDPNFTLPDPRVIDNATHIEFDESPFDVSLSQGIFYGYIFDLNVTAYTNSSFVLLDFTTPQNEYFLQSGKTIRNDPQPLYYPFSDITVHTDRIKTDDVWLNVTNLYFSFPQVWVDVNSTPGPGPAISLYMPKILGRQRVLQDSYFELKETSTSVKYPLVSSDPTPFGTPFQVLLKTVKIRRLTWI